MSPQLSLKNSSAEARVRLGFALALMLLAPACATLWTAWMKFSAPMPPAPMPLTGVGLGVLAINLICAFRLAPFCLQGGSLTRAAFLSARNDAIANLAIIGAGVVTAFAWQSVWPDLIVGFAVAATNADAARQVWQAARDEA